MHSARSPKKLARFLAFVLGREPQAFGLVPDEEGFVKIKELLKAITEEEGWRHVRRAHINEVLLVLSEPPVAVAEPMIRALDRSHLPPCEPDLSPPRLLYTSVRKRAYPHVAERGIHPSQEGRVVLSASREMALRIGRRSGRDPVLLTVHTGAAVDAGVLFNGFSGTLFLCRFLPAESFTGPPLPKEPPPPRSKRVQKPPADEEKSPGSFRLKGLPDRGGRGEGNKKRRKKEIDWKKGRRRHIKHGPP